MVKAGPEKGKTTPAGEYLTSALNDFDPDKYDGLATISDGANKLLMLVCIVDNSIVQSYGRNSITFILRRLQEVAFSVAVTS